MIIRVRFPEEVSSNSANREFGSRSHPEWCGTYPCWSHSELPSAQAIRSFVSNPSELPQPVGPVGGLYVGVSGEGLLNDDGTCRQEEIRRCLPGEKVQLLPDRSKAWVRVFSSRGTQIGEIVGEDAQTISEQLETGCRLNAVVNGIFGHASPNRRIVLLVSRQDDPIQQPRKAGYWPIFLRSDRK